MISLYFFFQINNCFYSLNVFAFRKRYDVNFDPMTRDQDVKKQQINFQFYSMY